MTTFKPSVEQQNIFDFIADNKGNLVISAFAGTGKTTTLLKILEKIPTDKSVLFMAFNKSIADELKMRVPKRTTINVSTVHGYGYRILSRNVETTINNRKYQSILNAIINQGLKKDPTTINSFNFDPRQLEWCRKIADILEAVYDDDMEMKEVKKNILTLCNLGRFDLVDTLNKTNGKYSLETIAKYHQIITNYKETEIAWYLIKIGYKYLKQIDFTDMVTLPLHLDLEFDEHDFVFVDECQDLNKCQKEIMERSVKKGGRTISVGDPLQSIYAFSGADAESFRKLTKRPNTTTLPLSVTYRCHKQILDLVKDINPDIVHREGNVNGQFIPDFSYEDLVDGDMVLCRNSLPVISLCVKLLSEGKRAHVVGSDIGLSLQHMVRDAKRQGVEYTMENVIGCLYRDLDRMIDATAKSYKITKEEAEEEPAVGLFNEKIEVIQIIAGTETDPEKVIAKIVSLFSDDTKKGIRLSTIHKSKGLESDRVFIIHPELMPSKYAKTEWQIEQEQNLKYVAYTRAKTVLGIINNYDAYNDRVSRPATTIIESKFVGKVGTKRMFVLVVLEIKDINTKFGPTKLYTLKDKEGNLFNVFGNIDAEHIEAVMKDVVEVGDEVTFFSVIKGHKEFMGQKYTTLGKITFY